MNVLSIGNSFSQDAQRYLYGIARAAGVTLHTFNLYIGGCPLSRHHRNMLSEEKAYTLEMNGISTGFQMSMKEALLSRDWDYITLQQVSNQSPKYDTYQPYLEYLVAYIRQLAPKAKLLIHETWGYEDGSYRLTEEMKYESYGAMLSDIRDAYERAAKDSASEFIIPSGEVLAGLIAEGIKVHRDTFHLSLGIGRYAVGLTWFKMLTGKDILDNTFSDFDVPVTEKEINLAKRIATEVCEEYKNKVILPF